MTRTLPGIPPRFFFFLANERGIIAQNSVIKFLQSEIIRRLKLKKLKSTFRTESYTAKQN